MLNQPAGYTIKDLWPLALCAWVLIAAIVAAIVAKLHPKR